MVHTQTTEKVIKAWGKRAQRTDIELKFEIEVVSNEAAIEEHKWLLGWQVYATNTIALVFSKYDLLLALMTDLKPTQIKILELLNISPNFYANLVTNIKIFFSQNIITET